MQKNLKLLTKYTMIYVDFPEKPAERRLSFYLAAEEFIARRLDAGDYFLMWQVEPTVIIGRHQAIASEVNESYCQQHHIQFYRRKSGGGCVYADSNNIMLSYVTAEEQINLSFDRFMNMLLLVLRKMGVEAVRTVHNDVLIGDRKVSGTALYHLPGRTIVHGTLLYDTNMEHMLHAITPSKEKLQSKGIQSVRQRITLLKDHVHLDIEEVKRLIRSTLCTSRRLLTMREMEQIKALEKNYLTDQFLYTL